MASIPNISWPTGGGLPPATYCNAVRMGFSQWDFMIEFSQMVAIAAPGDSPDQADPDVTVVRHVIERMLMSPQHTKAFLSVLAANVATTSNSTGLFRILCRPPPPKAGTSHDTVGPRHVRVDISRRWRSSTGLPQISRSISTRPEPFSVPVQAESRPGLAQWLQSEEARRLSGLWVLLTDDLEVVDSAPSPSPLLDRHPEDRSPLVVYVQPDDVDVIGAY